MAPERSLNPAQRTGLPNADSLIVGDVELTKIYSQAITEYLSAIYQKDKMIFDTLFLGKQPGFPEINFPTTINGTTIYLLKQEEVNNYKSAYRKSSPYINLIGFVENDTAEFIFVTFYPEFNHQYDCYMNFRYDSLKKEFDLEKQRIEVLIRDKEGRAEHYAIYEDGKYVGNKPVK